MKWLSDKKHPTNELLVIVKSIMIRSKLSDFAIGGTRMQTQSDQRVLMNRSLYDRHIFNGRLTIVPASVDFCASVASRFLWRYINALL